MAKRETITVKGELREKRGKGDSKKLRREGKIPITVYGGDAEPVSATVMLAQVATILRSDSGQNTVFKLDVADIGISDVMFHDRQIHPITSRLIHADLKRLVKGEKVHVTVELELVGEPFGVTEQSAHLEQVLREIEIECEPQNIPEKIEADVTHLHANEALHASDLKVPEGVKILTPDDTVVATVNFMTEEVEEPAAAEEGPTEPEVIGKGKKEEEE